MITITGLSYTHANGSLLFNNLNLVVNKHQKIALVGNNGSGKSTLLTMVAQNSVVNTGNVHVADTLYYVRQHVGQLNDLNVAEALGVSEKLAALMAIEKGDVSDANLTLVGNDWLLREQCAQALIDWGLENIGLDRRFQSLSGGQKTKVLLSGISIGNPELILLDEPTNHLDKSGRQMLYDFVKTTTKTLVVVSHDRTLLNLLDETLELVNGSIKKYGGNYTFYAEQKANEVALLRNELQNAQKDLKKIKTIERETLERKQKLDARGKKKQEKAGLPRIMQNTLKSNAENSTSKLRSVHAEKINAITEDVSRLRNALPALSEMKLSFDNSTLHYGKKLFEAHEINNVQGTQLLWKKPLSFTIYSGERIRITGENGSGKTTLMKILLGAITASGLFERKPAEILYIDQDYSVIRNHLTVIQQAQLHNTASLPEHEVKTRLHRFLFAHNTWDKSCASLSGGEKMRLMLCCLAIRHRTPDVIILDEPTNNLDIENVAILTEAIKNYQGTLIVTCHDDEFVKEISVEREISTSSTI